MHPTQILPATGTDPTADATTRRFDGKPETDADRRFFDLRESGYTGWIDQDGYTVDGPTFGTDSAELAEPAKPVTDLVTPATTLRAAATYLDRHGWIQGGYYEQTARGFAPAACLVGAIGMVCYGGQVDAPAQHFEDPGWGDFETAVAFMDGYLCQVDPYATDACSFNDVYSFNDTPGRTADQVTATLRSAADEWDRTQGGGA
jgi:hypothetical protein